MIFAYNGYCICGSSNWLKFENYASSRYVLKQSVGVPGGVGSYFHSFYNLQASWNISCLSIKGPI